MNQKLLLITPPFTQLNTPYPATAYLKGFLNTLGVQSKQLDLGLEVILYLFSKKGLSELFEIAEQSNIELDENLFRIFVLRNEYIESIDNVISFLQNKNPTVGHLIAKRNYLPEASRFNSLVDLDETFGPICVHDKAKYISTLYLEDLADFIKEIIDPHFGFSRYAERLGRMASSFDELLEELESENSMINSIMLKILNNHLEENKPSLVCLSIPFPGNLFSGLKIGQFIKIHYPKIKIALGGGFANTELRKLSDPRVFNYVDFICLDDGEATLQILLEHLNGKRELQYLKRTFTRNNNNVEFYNAALEKDIPQRETGTPDYRDLKLSEYLSVIEIANPMHRLWSDGRWNKLTLAHGCYWGKCTFCDVSLDYIGRYEPLSASELCDRIVTIIAQTGTSGFHFVDEAAPPALLAELAIELIRRKIKISWWTNIRFEKTFTDSLCQLLKASGCIAISGGLEVASDRLLTKMKKGVTVEQVTKVAYSFTKSGILVHAYLMYGFPTQTSQETIDSLEIVRQMFANDIIQSGFWHRFAMTAHSPVGLNPREFGVEDITTKFMGFADNDREHLDPQGCDHELFSKGLSTSLFNYMNGICLEEDISSWFDFDVPKTTHPENHIESILLNHDHSSSTMRPNAIVIWLLPIPELHSNTSEEWVELIFSDLQEDWSLELPKPLGEWLHSKFEHFVIGNKKLCEFSEFASEYESVFNSSITELTNSSTWEILTEKGLMVV